MELRQQLWRTLSSSPMSRGGMSTKHVTSLGISKAAHEFLTLHYFALDSAEWWEQILGELLPNAQFPAAVIRRTIAYQIMAAHIAPSHRRPPHPVWEDSLSLIADLLFGSGVDRYVGAMQRADSPLDVNVRGFSAGSYSGLAFLHILWSTARVTTKGCLGAIACPPALLSMSRAKRADRLHLIHYENDSLCSWKPGLRYKAAAPPLPISPMKSLPTRDTLDQMTMTTLTGWPLNYRMEVTLCVSCSLSDLQRLRRPKEMQPLSVSFPGLATNSTQSWNSSSRRQWSTFPLGQRLKGVKS